jgi:hypothetical protein
MRSMESIDLIAFSSEPVFVRILAPTRWMVSMGIFNYFCDVDELF